MFYAPLLARSLSKKSFNEFNEFLTSVNKRLDLEHSTWISVTLRITIIILLSVDIGKEKSSEQSNHKFKRIFKCNVDQGIFCLSTFILHLKHQSSLLQ